MNHLFATLQAVLGGRAARVIHVGAGSGAVLDAYQGLGLTHLVLVEGDPDLSSALSARAAVMAGVQAHAVALAPESGALLWNRYNLRALNGPLDAGGLVALYPRLVALSTLPLQAVGIAEWLEDQVPPVDGAPLVLVLDVPGQEAALLSVLPPALLQRFDAVITRGCGRPPSPAWDTAGAIEGHLQAQGFRRREPAGEQDPLWPVHLFQADADERERLAMRGELETLRQRCQAITDELRETRTAADADRQALQEQLDASRRDRDEQAHWHQENARWAQGLKAEKASLEAQLASQQAALQAMRDQALAREDAHRAALRTLQEQLDAARRERDEQSHGHQEHAQRAEILKAEKDALEAQLDAARAERDEHAHWHQEHAKSAHALKSEKESLEARLIEIQAELETLKEQGPAQVDAAEARVRTLQEQLDAARAERDEHAHWHQEHAKWAHALKSEKESLEARLVETQAEVQALGDQARVKTEAHAAAIATLHEQLDTVRRERDEQAKWHQENARWAQGLKAEKESLEKALSEARTAHDALTARLAERDARQRLLDAEIVRAEAQLDLIKDVLIREKNF